MPERMTKREEEEEGEEKIVELEGAEGVGRAAEVGGGVPPTGAPLSPPQQLLPQRSSMQLCMLLTSLQVGPSPPRPLPLHPPLPFLLHLPTQLLSWARVPLGP